MKSVTVIVPCYNEELVILESYTRISTVLSSLDYDSCILFVNDGSSDATLKILRGIAEKDNRVSVLSFSRNFGHQAAVSAGINHCTTDFAIIIDADLQDPPEVIPDMLRMQEAEQANVVYCVRKERKGEGTFKKTTAKWFYRMLNSMSDTNFPVDTGDFRLIDRKIIDQFDQLTERGKYIRGLISWMGFKQVPFYYSRDARWAGTTKYPLSKMFGFATNAFLYFSKKPLKLAISMGFLSVVVGILLALWSVGGKFFGVTIIPGWTSLMITVIFFGGVQLLTIGVLGQYIGVLFDEVKHRPEYIVDEKINVKGKYNTSN